MITEENKMSREINQRIHKKNRYYHILIGLLKFRNAKIKIYRTVIISMLMFVSDSGFYKGNERRVMTFENKIYVNCKGWDRICEEN